LRVIGVPLRDVAEAPPVVSGVDVPRGIEHLDVEWFLARLSVDALAACKTDEELYRMRARAEMARELVTLKDAAMRRPGDVW
jgi:hypothetical protein